LKNQQFYVNALASYLPDPSDPDYAKYEAKLPEYKANLEKRYPQVCAKCVEQVNNRIKSMTYLTKAENLKVSLDRTRKRQFANETGWKGKAVTLGWFLWHGSVLGQILWHLLGAMSNSSENKTSVSSVSLQLVQECSKQVLAFGNVDIGCFDSVTTIMPRILQAGLVSIWWNNRLQESMQGYGRLTYLNDYYAVQVIFLGIRYLAYILLSQPSRFNLPIPPLAAHAFVIIFSLICTISSKTTVQLRKRPNLADYKARPVEAPEPEFPPLTLDGPLNQDSQHSFASMPSLAHTGSTLSAQSHIDHNIPNGFPVSSLSVAGKTRSQKRQAQKQQQEQDIWAPRSVRSGSVSSSSAFSHFLDDRMSEGAHDSPDLDSSEMDWTPTHPSGPAMTSLTPVRPMLERIPEGESSSQRNGFFGGGGLSLPPAPAHPAHKRVKPAGTFNAFEARGMRSKGGLLAGTDESETETETKGKGLFGRKSSGKNKAITSRLADRNEIPMAAPRLTLGGEGKMEGDTGLEGLFNSVFSLSDRPQEVAAQGDIIMRDAGAVLSEERESREWRSALLWASVVVAVLACIVGLLADGSHLKHLEGSTFMEVAKQVKDTIASRLVGVETSSTPGLQFEIPQEADVLEASQPQWAL
jgi:hypothetical protein